jgi:hypothetical protein
MINEIPDYGPPKRFLADDKTKLGGPNADVLDRIEKMNKPKLVQDWPPKHVYEDAVIQGE